MTRNSLTARVRAAITAALAAATATAAETAAAYQQGTRPAPSSAIGDGFMNIPDGVEDEGLPFN